MKKLVIPTGDKEAFIKATELFYEDEEVSECEISHTSPDGEVKVIGIIRKVLR